MDLSFSMHCEEALMDYSWPGNLRELRNAVERGVILSPASILEPQDLGLEVPIYGIADEAASNRPDIARSAIPVLGEDFPLTAIEREHIARVVARAASFDAAAHILGIDPSTLQRKRKRYGLA